MTDLEWLLQELLDRDAIRNVITRYFRGVDERDVDLVRSVYHDDAADTRGPRILSGPGIADELVRSNQESMVSTRHHVTTHQVEIEGDVATSVTYCLGVHVPVSDVPKHLHTSGGTPRRELNEATIEEVRERIGIPVRYSPRNHNERASVAEICATTSSMSGEVVSRG